MQTFISEVNIFTYDLVLTSGMEFTARLLELESNKSLPKIAVFDSASGAYKRIYHAVLVSVQVILIALIEPANVVLITGGSDCAAWMH